MGTVGGRRMPARRAWLAATVLLVQPLVLAGAHVATADGSSGSSATSASSNAGLSADAKASQKAADSGSPVVVDEDTTPTEQVTALPDGTFRLDAATTPVRTNQGGTWVPLDTTLAAQADGSLKPKAAVTDLTFSGGGSSTPLATMSQGGLSYSVSAPWTLPVPTVSGSTATYASVLPDVDLVVSAVPEGFTENVVVKTRAAAQDPQLASLRFPVSETGLTVKDQPSGGAALVDDQGRPVFSTGSALAWDSTPGSGPAGSAQAKVKSQSAQMVAGPADTTVEPDPGSKTSVMDVAIDSSSMTVTPDQGFLSDPSTVYPVVLDPQTVSQSLAGWTALWSTEASTSFWKTSHSLGVGYEYPVDDKKVRSLYQFDTHGVEGKKVLNATFTAEEVWANNCTPEPVELWHTGGISPSTTWNRQPSWMGKVDTVTTAKGWSANCPGGNVEFDATSAVAYGAVRDGATTTVGLRADESDGAQWKQFASPSDAKPVLSVTYVSAPALPTGLKLSIPNLKCGINMAAAVGIRSLTPSLSATPMSADTSQATMRPNFEVHRYDPNTADPVVGSGSPSAWTASKTAGTWVSPTLTNGQTYWFRARTQYQYSFDGTTASLYSAWTPGCWFTIDTSKPLPPSVTSLDYQPCADENSAAECVASGAVDSPGSFTFTADTSTPLDVVTYTYTLNGEKPVTQTFSKPTASMQVKALSPNVRGVNVLRVTTEDAAGNISEPTDYSFNVAPGAAAIDGWSFDEGSGSTAADPLGSHQAQLSGGATWTQQGRVHSALSVDGVNGVASVTPIGLNASKSFTISAWARLSSLTKTGVVASQDATSSSAFSLYYSSGGQWAFNRNASDTPAPTVVRSASTITPLVGVWTHLLGVYDAQAQTIQLYVNGVPQGNPVAFTTPWSATGPLQIGGGQYGGNAANYFSGQIDEVQLWNRVVSPQEIGDLQTVTDDQGVDHPAAAGEWDLGDAAGTTAADSSGYGRTGTVERGATWWDDTDQNMGNVLALDGSADSYVWAPGPIVDSQGDFTVSIWVDLDSQALQDTSTAHTMRIAGQSGTTRDSWGLWYTQPAGQPDGTWVFGRTSDDSSAVTTTTTTAPADPTAGVLASLDQWTMLTGVYDAAHGKLELYVNGSPDGVVGDDPGDGSTGGGTAFPKQPWQATGVFSIGRGRTSSGAYGDATTGMVAKAHVWTGLLSDADVSVLYQKERPSTFPDE